MDGQIKRQRYEVTDGQTDRWKNGLSYERRDKLLDKWTDGRTDGQINKRIDG
jgi:hypothetical protein